MQERLALGFEPGPLHFKFRCLPTRPKSILCGYSSAKFESYSEKRGKKLGGGGGGGGGGEQRETYMLSLTICACNIDICTHRGLHIHANHFMTE